MKILSLGSSGPEVEEWQDFLNGVGIFCETDGYFGEETRKCTLQFQSKYICPPTGQVDRITYGMAIRYGFLEVHGDDKKSSSWPPTPKGLRPMNSADKVRAFGEFSYKPKPTASNPERVDIDDTWEKENIKVYYIPQLLKVSGYPSYGVKFHKKVGPRVQKFFEDVEKEGLLKLVLTWNGSYVTRFIRGSRTTLSNHCYGSAFDINVAYNRLGSMPALYGSKGSVREIVPIANQNGLWWGGHFSKRKDGMHFELAEKV